MRTLICKQMICLKSKEITLNISFFHFIIYWEQRKTNKLKQLEEKSEHVKSKIESLNQTYLFESNGINNKLANLNEHFKEILYLMVCNLIFLLKLNKLY